MHTLECRVSAALRYSARGSKNCNIFVKTKKPLKPIGGVLKEGVVNRSRPSSALRILRKLRKSILNLFSKLESPKTDQNDKLSFSTFESVVSSFLNRMRRLPRKSEMSYGRYGVKSNFRPLKVEIGQQSILGQNSNIFFLTKKRNKTKQKKRKKNGLANSSTSSLKCIDRSNFFKLS